MPLPKRGSILLASLEPWDEIWRRNQFLSRELAERGWRILWLSPAKRIFRSDLSLRKRPATSEPLPGVFVYTPLVLGLTSRRLVQRLNSRLYRLSVLNASQRSGIPLQQGECVYWINDHNAADYLDYRSGRGCVYDITDDWTRDPALLPHFRHRVVQQDLELCRNADLTIVCSRSLFDSRKTVSPRIELLPNGVDYEHYKDVQVLDHARSPATFGYTGTLHSSRLDLKLVAATAKRLPHAKFVFVGPNHLAKEEIRLLQSHENIEIRPPVPYSEIPQVMSSFDVCFVPHLSNDFTESLNPLKLWEYLASGLPIVSTDIAGFRDYKGLFALAPREDIDAFVSCCEFALADRCKIRVGSRRHVAQGQSWSSRAEIVDNWLIQMQDCQGSVHGIR